MYKLIVVYIELLPELFLASLGKFVASFMAVYFF